MALRNRSGHPYLKEIFLMLFWPICLYGMSAIRERWAGMSFAFHGVGYFFRKQLFPAPDNE